MAKTIKVGVVGGGFMGGMHTNCYAAAAGAELVAVCDVREDLAVELAKPHKAAVYTNAEKMFADAGLDMVDVCLPTNMHCEFVVKAAKAGLNVLCEKPIATSVAEANKMIAATKKAGVQFMVAQVIRFWPEYMILKRYVDEKKLGGLLNLQMTRVSPRPTWSWKNWLQDQKLSGGALIDLHIHDADFVRYLMGDPVAIQAAGTYSKGRWDHIFVNYVCKKGVAQAEGGWGFPAQFPFCMKYTALFEKGTLDYNCNNSPALMLYPADGGKPKAIKPPKPKVGAAAAGGNISDLGGYYNEIKYFIDCLRKGEKPTITTPEDARDSLALVVKELKAAERSLK